MKTIIPFVIFLIGIVKCDVLANTSPLLMKILQAVEVSSTDERLLDVTSQLLEGLCLCMRETLKTKTKNASNGQDKTEVELYNNIYNKTCITLSHALHEKFNVTCTPEDKLFGGCADEKNAISQMDTTEGKTRRKIKMESILYKLLVHDKNFHNYTIRRNSLFSNIRKNGSELSKRVILIITLNSNATKSEGNLNGNFNIDIDIFSAFQDTNLKPKKVRSFCMLFSIYNFLVKKDLEGDIKVFNVLKSGQNFKVYIDVKVADEIEYQRKITESCCNGANEQFCTISNIERNHNMLIEKLENNSTRDMKFKQTVINIKRLLKIYTEQNIKKTNKLSNNFDHDGNCTFGNTKTSTTIENLTEKLNTYIINSVGSSTASYYEENTPFYSSLININDVTTSNQNVVFNTDNSENLDIHKKNYQVITPDPFRKRIRISPWVIKLANNAVTEAEIKDNHIHIIPDHTNGIETFHKSDFKNFKYLNSQVSDLPLISENRISYVASKKEPSFVIRHDYEVQGDTGTPYHSTTENTNEAKQPSSFVSTEKIPVDTQQPLNNIHLPSSDMPVPIENKYYDQITDKYEGKTIDNIVVNSGITVTRQTATNNYINIPWAVNTAPRNKPAIPLQKEDEMKERIENNYQKISALRHEIDIDITTKLNEYVISIKTKPKSFDKKHDFDSTLIATSLDDNSNYFNEADFKAFFNKEAVNKSNMKTRTEREKKSNQIFEMHLNTAPDSITTDMDVPTTLSSTNTRNYHLTPNNVPEHTNRPLNPFNSISSTLQSTTKISDLPINDINKGKSSESLSKTVLNKTRDNHDSLANSIVNQRGKPLRSLLMMDNRENSAYTKEQFVGSTEVFEEFDNDLKENVETNTYLTETKSKATNEHKVMGDIDSHNNEPSLNRITNNENSLVNKATSYNINYVFHNNFNETNQDFVQIEAPEVFNGNALRKSNGAKANILNNNDTTELNIKTDKEGSSKKIQGVSSDFGFKNKNISLGSYKEATIGAETTKDQSQHITTNYLETVHSIKDKDTYNINKSGIKQTESYLYATNELIKNNNTIGKYNETKNSSSNNTAYYKTADIMKPINWTIANTHQESEKEELHITKVQHEIVHNSGTTLRDNKKSSPYQQFQDSVTEPIVTTTAKAISNNLLRIPTTKSTSLKSGTLLDVTKKLTEGEKLETKNTNSVYIAEDHATTIKSRLDTFATDKIKTTKNVGEATQVTEAEKTTGETATEANREFIHLTTEKYINDLQTTNAEIITSELNISQDQLQDTNEITYKEMRFPKEKLSMHVAVDKIKKGDKDAILAKNISIHDWLLQYNMLPFKAPITKDPPTTSPTTFITANVKSSTLSSEPINHKPNKMLSLSKNDIERTQNTNSVKSFTEEISHSTTHISKQATTVYLDNHKTAVNKGGDELPETHTKSSGNTGTDFINKHISNKDSFTTDKPTTTPINQVSLAIDNSTITPMYKFTIDIKASAIDNNPTKVQLITLEDNASISNATYHTKEFNSALNETLISTNTDIIMNEMKTNKFDKFDVLRNVKTTSTNTSKTSKTSRLNTVKDHVTIMPSTAGVQEPTTPYSSISKLNIKASIPNRVPNGDITMKTLHLKTQQPTTEQTTENVSKVYLKNDKTAVNLGEDELPVSHIKSSGYTETALNSKVLNSLINNTFKSTNTTIIINEKKKIKLIDDVLGNIKTPTNNYVTSPKISTLNSVKDHVKTISSTVDVKESTTSYSSIDSVLDMKTSTSTKSNQNTPSRIINDNITLKTLQPNYTHHTTKSESKVREEIISTDLNTPTMSQPMTLKAFISKTPTTTAWTKPTGDIETTVSSTFGSITLSEYETSISPTTKHNNEKHKSNVIKKKYGVKSNDSANKTGNLEIKSIQDVHKLTTAKNINVSVDKNKKYTTSQTKKPTKKVNIATIRSKLVIHPVTPIIYETPIIPDIRSKNTKHKNQSPNDAKNLDELKNIDEDKHLIQPENIILNHGREYTSTNIRPANLDIQSLQQDLHELITPRNIKETTKQMKNSATSGNIEINASKTVSYSPTSPTMQYKLKKHKSKVLNPSEYLDFIKNNDKHLLDLDDVTSKQDYIYTNIKPANLETDSWQDINQLTTATNTKITADVNKIGNLHNHLLNLYHVTSNQSGDYTSTNIKPANLDSQILQHEELNNEKVTTITTTEYSTQNSFTKDPKTQKNTNEISHDKKIYSLKNNDNHHSLDIEHVTSNQDSEYTSTNINPLNLETKGLEDVNQLTTATNIKVTTDVSKYNNTSKIKSLAITEKDGIGITASKTADSIGPTEYITQVSPKIESEGETHKSKVRSHSQGLDDIKNIDIGKHSLNLKHVTLNKNSKINIKPANLETDSRQVKNQLTTATNTKITADVNKIDNTNLDQSISSQVSENTFTTIKPIKLNIKSSLREPELTTSKTINVTGDINRQDTASKTKISSSTATLTKSTMTNSIRTIHTNYNENNEAKTNPKSNEFSYNDSVPVTLTTTHQPISENVDQTILEQNETSESHKIKTHNLQMITVEPITMTNTAKLILDTNINDLISTDSSYTTSGIVDNVSKRTTVQYETKQLWKTTKGTVLHETPKETLKKTSIKTLKKTSININSKAETYPVTENNSNAKLRHYTYTKHTTTLSPITVIRETPIPTTTRYFRISSTPTDSGSLKTSLLDSDDNANQIDMLTSNIQLTTEKPTSTKTKQTRSTSTESFLRPSLKQTTILPSTNPDITTRNSITSPLQDLETNFGIKTTTSISLPAETAYYTASMDKINKKTKLNINPLQDLKTNVDIKTTTSISLPTETSFSTATSIDETKKKPKVSIIKDLSTPERPITSQYDVAMTESSKISYKENIITTKDKSIDNNIVDTKNSIENKSNSEINTSISTTDNVQYLTTESTHYQSETHINQSNIEDLALIETHALDESRSEPTNMTTDNQNTLYNVKTKPATIIINNTSINSKANGTQLNAIVSDKTTLLEKTIKTSATSEEVKIKTNTTAITVKNKFQNEGMMSVSNNTNIEQKDIKVFESNVYEDKNKISTTLPNITLFTSVITERNCNKTMVYKSHKNKISIVHLAMPVTKTSSITANDNKLTSMSVEDKTLPASMGKAVTKDDALRMAVTEETIQLLSKYKTINIDENARVVETVTIGNALNKPSLYETGMEENKINIETYENSAKAVKGRAISILSNVDLDKRIAQTTSDSTFTVTPSTSLKTVKDPLTLNDWDLSLITEDESVMSITKRMAAIPRMTASNGFLYLTTDCTSQGIQEKKKPKLDKELIKKILNSIKLNYKSKTAIENKNVPKTVIKSTQTRSHTNKNKPTTYYDENNQYDSSEKYISDVTDNTINTSFSTLTDGHPMSFYNINNPTTKTLIDKTDTEKSNKKKELISDTKNIHKTRPKDAIINVLAEKRPDFINISTVLTKEAYKKLESTPWNNDIIISKIKQKHNKEVMKPETSTKKIESVKNILSTEKNILTENAFDSNTSIDTTITTAKYDKRKIKNIKKLLAKLSKKGMITKRPLSKYSNIVSSLKKALRSKTQLKSSKSLTKLSSEEKEMASISTPQMEDTTVNAPRFESIVLVTTDKITPSQIISTTAFETTNHISNNTLLFENKTNKNFETSIDITTSSKNLNIFKNLHTTVIENTTPFFKKNKNNEDLVHSEKRTSLKVTSTKRPKLLLTKEGASLNDDTYGIGITIRSVNQRTNNTKERKLQVSVKKLLLDTLKKIGSHKKHQDFNNDIIGLIDKSKQMNIFNSTDSSVTRKIMKSTSAQDTHTHKPIDNPNIDDLTIFHDEQIETSTTKIDLLTDKTTIRPLRIIVNNSNIKYNSKLREKSSVNLENSKESVNKKDDGNFNNNLSTSTNFNRNISSDTIENTKAEISTKSNGEKVYHTKEETRIKPPNEYNTRKPRPSVSEPQNLNVASTTSRTFYNRTRMQSQTIEEEIHTKEETATDTLNKHSTRIPKYSVSEPQNPNVASTTSHTFYNKTPIQNPTIEEENYTEEEKTANTLNKHSTRKPKSSESESQDSNVASLTSHASFNRTRMQSQTIEEKIYTKEVTATNTLNRHSTRIPKLSVSEPQNPNVGSTTSHTFYNRTPIQNPTIEEEIYTKEEKTANTLNKHSTRKPKSFVSESQDPNVASITSHTSYNRTRMQSQTIEEKIHTKEETATNTLNRHSTRIPKSSVSEPQNPNVGSTTSHTFYNRTPIQNPTIEEEIYTKEEKTANTLNKHSTRKPKSFVSESQDPNVASITSHASYNRTRMQSQTIEEKIYTKEETATNTFNRHSTRIPKSSVSEPQNPNVGSTTSHTFNNRTPIQNQTIEHNIGIDTQGQIEKRLKLTGEAQTKKLKAKEVINNMARVTKTTKDLIKTSTNLSPTKANTKEEATEKYLHLESTTYLNVKSLATTYILNRTHINNQTRNNNLQNYTKGGTETETLKTQLSEEETENRPKKVTVLSKAIHVIETTTGVSLTPAINSPLQSQNKLDTNTMKYNTKETDENVEHNIEITTYLDDNTVTTSRPLHNKINFDIQKVNYNLQQYLKMQMDKEIINKQESEKNAIIATVTNESKVTKAINISKSKEDFNPNKPLTYAFNSPNTLLKFMMNNKEKEVVTDKPILESTNYVKATQSLSTDEYMTTETSTFSSQRIKVTLSYKEFDTKTAVEDNVSNSSNKTIPVNVSFETIGNKQILNAPQDDDIDYILGGTPHIINQTIAENGIHQQIDNLNKLIKIRHHKNDRQSIDEIIKELIRKSNKMERKHKSKLSSITVTKRPNQKISEYAKLHNDNFKSVVDSDEILVNDNKSSFTKDDQIIPFTTQQPVVRTSGRLQGFKETNRPVLDEEIIKNQDTEMQFEINTKAPLMFSTVIYKPTEAVKKEKVSLESLGRHIKELLKIYKDMQNAKDNLDTETREKSVKVILKPSCNENKCKQKTSKKNQEHDKTKTGHSVNLAQKISFIVNEDTKDKTRVLFKNIFKTLHSTSEKAPKKTKKFDIINEHALFTGNPKISTKISTKQCIENEEDLRVKVIKMFIKPKDQAPLRHTSKLAESDSEENESNIKAQLEEFGSEMVTEKHQETKSTTKENIQNKKSESKYFLLSSRDRFTLMNVNNSAIREGAIAGVPTHSAKFGKIKLSDIVDTNNDTILSILNISELWHNNSTLKSNVTLNISTSTSGNTIKATNFSPDVIKLLRFNLFPSKINDDVSNSNRYKTYNFIDTKHIPQNQIKNTTPVAVKQYRSQTVRYNTYEPSTDEENESKHYSRWKGRDNQFQQSIKDLQTSTVRIARSFTTYQNHIQRSQIFKYGTISKKFKKLKGEFNLMDPFTKLNDTPLKKKTVKKLQNTRINHDGPQYKIPIFSQFEGTKNNLATVPKNFVTTETSWNNLHFRSTNIGNKVSKTKSRPRKLQIIRKIFPRPILQESDITLQKAIKFFKDSPLLDLDNSNVRYRTSALNWKQHVNLLQSALKTNIVTTRAPYVNYMRLIPPLRKMHKPPQGLREKVASIKSYVVDMVTYPVREDVWEDVDYDKDLSFYYRRLHYGVTPQAKVPKKTKRKGRTMFFLSPTAPTYVF